MTVPGRRRAHTRCASSTLVCGSRHSASVKVPSGSKQPVARTGTPSRSVSTPSPCPSRSVRASRYSAARFSNSLKVTVNLVCYTSIHPDTACSWVAQTKHNPARASSDHPALTSTLRSGLIASGFFGSVTVSTPFLKFASILSGSTPSGSWNERWKAP